MQKIAIAPNAFRGSLHALEATEKIKNGLEKSNIACEIISMPLADGGDGTLDVLIHAKNGKYINKTINNPIGEKITAQFGITDQTAIIEMAKASGIELITTTERNPLKTTTYGTGELIKSAIDSGATTILIGIGGSATVDGGAGCLQALGAKLLDSNNNPISYGGEALKQLAHIDPTPLHKMLQGITIRVLCDVDNPLLGSNGAAAVFGPQKGADTAMVEQLEENLTHYAEILERDLGVSIQNVPGAGAAGGLSAGLMAVAGAELVSGIEELIKACGYDKRLAQGDIDLVITGEGKLDSQTIGGKAPLGIAREAAKYNIPVVAFAGAVTAPISQLQEWGIKAAWSIVPQPCSLDTALENAGKWLTEAATNLGNLLALH